MEIAPGTVPDHRLVGLVGDVRAALDKAAVAPAWSLSSDDCATLLPEIARAEAQLAELKMRALLQAETLGVGHDQGFTSAAHWLARTTRQVKPGAVGTLAIARRLDNGHEPIRAALASGEVLVEQATTILRAVEALPDDIDASIRADAEEHLVAAAAEFDAKGLRILGRKVLEVVAPEVAEDQEYRALLAEETHAAATSSFRMRSDGHGSTYGWFKIPDLAAAMLRKALDAFAAPKRGADQSVARPLRLGAAFCEYVETRTEVPEAGGVAATVVITASLEDLLGEARVATLDTGDRITADEAVRLLCNADLVPAFLAGPLVELNLGRSRRLFSKHQRIALGLRYGGCAEEHCDWPPGMCHAHHRDPWAQGGATNLDDGILLCPRHHALAHNRRYQMKTSKNGAVTFSKRT